MPAALTYPGVYIEEIPSGVRTITGVATSIAAFVGRARRGPVGKGIVINGFADFERRFGGLWEPSTLGFAVRDFFLNGGAQAVIVRVYSPDSEAELDKAMEEAATAAKAVADAVGQATAAAGATPASVKAAADAAVAAAGAASDSAKTAATSVATVAKDAADAGASMADIAKKAKAAVPLAAAVDAAREQATAAAQAVSKQVADRAEATPAPSMADLKAAADKAATEAAKAGDAAKTAAQEVAGATKTAADTAGATVGDVVAKTKAAVSGAIDKAAGFTLSKTRAALDARGLILEAASAGTWGNALRARVDKDVSKDVADSLHVDVSKLFNLTVRDTKNDVTEVFRNLTVDPSARQVASVLSAESNLVRVQIPPGTLPAAHGPIKSDSKIWDDDTLSSKVTDAVADDGRPLARADFTGPGTQEKKRGLYALKDVDIFNLLCIPPHLHAGDIEQGLIDDAVTLCTERRAIFLVDPPSAWKDKDAAKSGIDSQVGTASKNAAIFFPRLLEPNLLHEDRLEEFVPCGAAAGVFARTDTTRGVWKAPAGLDATLSGVPQLTVKLTDLENGELNQLGINCLRTMPAAGRLIWGARTRVGDDRLASEWKYIPVRRTALYIEESLFRGTQWVVFEPNDEPLWAEIRLNVGAFMQGLFRQGAFQGRSPREAYFVKCDRETTTQDDINRGIVNIVVGFAPLKPAEFVVIKLQQMAGQIQT